MFLDILKIQCFKTGGSTGADLGFSRGGADFQKKIENFDDIFFFFRSTKSIFRALPKHWFAPI